MSQLFSNAIGMDITSGMSNVSQKVISNSGLISRDPLPYMYISIFCLWTLSIIWFQPRLFSTLQIAYDIPSFATLLLFILFIDLAWLYGIFNICVILFGVIYNRFHAKPEDVLVNMTLIEFPAVAILYTTYNDFVEQSVQSCIDQDYPNFKVYLLDDSTNKDYMEKVDAFAEKHPDKLEVVRRSNRKAFKAGNMNNGLSHFAVDEPYFAIADADEILPANFLSKLVPVMESDDNCGFVQANHSCNPQNNNALGKAMGIGINIHWEYYQPLRNAYGFVMFLGHGALIRRKCWEEIGGFPDIVSEDLGFAIEARNLGYRGRFVKDVMCYEDFPDSVRSFRIRHMKWTRGTCEFLHKRFKTLITAKNITWTEKLDILFPTLNLPLTLIYFFFMVIANLGIPYFFGQAEILTLEIGGSEFAIPAMTLGQGFNVLYTWDFYLITLITFFAPVLCFIIGMWKRPIRLIKFISHSTALYAALGPLSSIGVLSYLISGKALFLVTGDTTSFKNVSQSSQTPLIKRIKNIWRQLIEKSHPDTHIVQGIEILIGLSFGLICIYMLQISFFGLCLAFMFMPLLHKIGWNNKLSRMLIHLPFICIMIGVILSGLSLAGMQTVFFGYGFHF